MRRPGSTSCTAVRMTALAVACLALAACGGGTSPAAARADQSFVDAVHSQASDISQYRSDTQLIRLGRAACDGFASGVSYEQLADRLSVSSASGSLPGLPTEDLGTVIAVAVETFCPRYQDQVG